MKTTYPILTFFIVFVIGFGLLNVVKEDLEVAPWSEKGAEEGRLIANTKNVTRIVGENAADIHKYLKNAIPYPEATTADKAPTEKSWEQFVLETIKPNPKAKHVIVLPVGKKEALQWALPAIYFAFYYGSPLVFVNDGKIVEGEQYTSANLKAFIIGGEDWIPRDVASRFSDHERIAGRNLYDHAATIAEFRDHEYEFGWGRKHHRRTGYFHYVVTTPNDAVKGLAALPYAASNNASLLYADDDGGLPAELDRYIWSQRTDRFRTPSEGPFKHFWLVSDLISYAAQSRMDFAIEKSDYPSMGDVGLGYMEALAIMIIVLGIASSLFVMLHSAYTLSMVKMPIKIAWTLASLLLPILGPVLYLSAYRRPAMQNDEGEWRFIRPQNIQSAAATAMSFGYGAPLMIAIGFVFVWFGFPIFYSNSLGSSASWLGAGMPIMMFAMYVLAVLIVWPMVQFPMKKMMMKMPEKKIIKMAFVTTALSMASVSLGMMTMAWWMMMYHLPMMPKDDDILWFGSMWLASIVGFLVAWPLNWIMIRKQLKPGNV